jgi:hypothetical protein
MHFVKKSFAAAALIAASMVGASYSQAQTVYFNSAGSSAQWQTFALAAAQLATKGAPYTVHRYTAKGAAADGNPYAGIADNRKTSGTQTPPNTTPPVESGNIWIVWNENGNGTPVAIYAFTSVDSVIGLRSFFAVPRAKVALDVAVESTKGQQLISATLPYWGTEDSSVPAAVYNVLNDLPLTAANTDIRPEDGLFAFNRIIGTLNTTNYDGLGYGPGLIGTGIKSHYSATVATPVSFSLTGADPITGDAHPSGGYITVPVGASPIVFAVNQTGLTFGSHDLSVTESTGNTAEKIFSGTNCIFKGITVNPILREPLSGTYNTTEFTDMRLSANEDLSQEVGVNPANANNNPLDLTCAAGGGTRTRAIGTGESIKALYNNDGLGGTGAGNINYAFFGYGNYSAEAANADYSYLTLDTVDPINASFSNGELPSCAASGCPIAGGASFPNLRNGKYRSWSLLRVVTDTDSANPTNYTNTVALVNAADKLINKSVPDFVPFLASCSTSGANEPGLDVYRSHYTQSGVTGVNGSVPTTVDCAAHTGEAAQTLEGLTLGGGTEAGGDVGGKIQGPFTTSPTEPGVLNEKQ